jgi:FAD/FMN-containing dehydrogenase
MRAVTDVDTFVEALTAVVGVAHVLTEPDMMAGFEVDWTRRWRGRARAVVRPGSTSEVVSCLRCCADAGVAVVPQGGNTGLVGGGVPRGGEVVVSLTRLGGLGDVDPVAAQVSAGAGVTLARLQAHVGAAGLCFGVDLAARDSATVGGMVATNAGGLHVLRYGSMRAQVLGIEAVLADGSVVRRMDGLVKDNTGYDVAGLLCGSEGTLAVVTEVRLRLVPAWPHRVTALVGVSGLTAALDLLVRLRSVPGLEAVEVMFADGVELVRTHAGLGSPPTGPAPCQLVVECADAEDPTERLGLALAGPGVASTAVAADPVGRARLWAWRERHTEAVNALGVPHKLDVTLPLGRLAEFEAAVRPAVAGVSADAVVVMWGHLGDGNLHVNVVGPPADEEGVDDAVLRLAAAHGGSISAEHGIGVAKRRWLGLTRAPADVAAMRAIKQALDPAGILNPGVLWALGR